MECALGTAHCAVAVSAPAGLAPHAIVDPPWKEAPLQFHGLVTGSSDLIAEVSTAMSRAGWGVVGIDRPDLLGENCRTFDPSSFDCYIQLPADIEVGSSTSLDRVKGLLTQGLLRRISGASRALPLLRPGACVVLASGDHRLPVDSPDDRGAMRRLLNVVAQSIMADTAGSNIDAFVVDEGWSVDAIVKLVCHHTLVAGALEGDIEGAERASGRSSGSPVLAEVAPDLAYSEWRDELFSLCGAPHRTYLGWSAEDGSRRVAILRGAVLTPLRVTASMPELSWNGSRSARLGLAQALLGDGLGVAARCGECKGAEPGCAGCRGSGLSHWAAALLDDFVDEVISTFPSDGFELPQDRLLLWVSQQGVAQSSGGAGQPRL